MRFPLMLLWLVATVLSLTSCASRYNPPHSTHDASLLTASTVNTNTDWAQYAYDQTRSGYNPKETVLGVSSVPSLHLKWSAKLDSGIYAQPLFIRSVPIAGVLHDVLYVASFFNAFAIDPYGSDGATTASSVKTFWKTALPGATINCAGTPFQSGTWGTPYIDKPSFRMYLVDGRPIWTRWTFAPAKCCSAQV